MTTPAAPPRPPAVAVVETTSTDWDAKLIARVRQLRTRGKRVILLIDGTRVFVFAAEPAGTLAIE